MRILLTSPEQSSKTGQPMYVKNLAKGLKELGHEVVCSESPSGDYDLAVINDFFPDCLGSFTAKKIFNICHSKNGCDQPIIDNRIDRYLAPRKEVADRWSNLVKCDILEIPIDFNRWKKELVKHNGYRIIAPCAFEPSRLPMLRDLCSRANERCSVWLVGRDYGILRYLELNDYVTIFPETEKIEDLMCDCDEVAGIFIGTVTLEAWAMGLKTSVYDEAGRWRYVEKSKDFNKHNYKKVAQKLLNLYEI